MLDIRAVMIITGNVKQIMSGQKMVDFISVIIPRLTSPNPWILWKYSGWVGKGQGQGQPSKVSKRGNCLFSGVKASPQTETKTNTNANTNTISLANWRSPTNKYLSGVKASFFWLIFTTFVANTEVSQTLNPNKQKIATNTELSIYVTS